MIIGCWLCSHCAALLWKDHEAGEWLCSACGREYVERDGGLVPLVQPGEPEEGGRHAPRLAGRRHAAGWREKEVS